MIHRLGKPKTKVREKQSLVEFPIGYKSYSIETGALVAQGGPMSYHPFTTRDEISSTNRLSSKSSKANNCVHTKERTVINDAGTQTLLWYSAANPTVRMSYYGASYDSEYCLGLVLPTALNSLSVSGTNYLRNNAVLLMTSNFDSLKPDLTELSVPNFVLDLDQISSLFKFWKYGAGLVKNVANANLNYQFGWRPTIGDAQAAISAILGLHDKLEAFRLRLGKLTHKSKVVDTGSESHTGTYVSGAYTINWCTTRSWSCQAFIAYRPLPIAEMTAFERHLRGILDSLGFEINAEIVWDAIPFSFILDWFLDVGLLCRQFRLDTLELPIKLEDSYLQYKEQVRVDSKAIYALNNVNVQPMYCSGASYEKETFHRLSAQPDYQSLVWSGWHFPSTNQALLGLSLVASR